MSQEETSSDNGAQGGKGRRQTDAGDVVAIICCVICVLGAIWQFIDFGFLGGAIIVADSFDIHLNLVWLGALSNVVIWAFSAYLAYQFKNEEQMTAGARVMASIACVCAARFLVWAFAQLFGWAAVEGGLWIGAYSLICLLALSFGWELVKMILDESNKS